jgi:hypothetical protein
MRSSPTAFFGLMQLYSRGAGKTIGHAPAAMDGGSKGGLISHQLQSSCCTFLIGPL